MIVEPIQGEGGVNIPDPDYLKNLSNLCAEHKVLLIVDEVQTGFCRTGPMFMSNNVTIDILTMAKGIAGGFPFAGFAITEKIHDKIEKGDHGGTYSGNPLGCAVAYSVIKYILDNKMWENVEYVGKYAITKLRELKKNILILLKTSGKRIINCC